MNRLFIFLTIIVIDIFMLNYNLLLGILFILASPFILKILPHNHSHGSFLSIDFYAQNSKLYNINANVKIFFSILMLIFCIGANSVLISLEITIIMLYITVFKGRIKMGYYFSLLTIPFTFIFLSTIAIVFNFSNKPLGYIDISILKWFICITPKSKYIAILLISKSIGAISCLYMLNLSTPMHEIIDVLKKFKIPSIVIELMYLIYRYIFILLDIQNNMSIASQSRLGYSNLKSHYYTFLSIASNLLMLSFKKSSVFFDAMESRCYEGSICFLEEEKPIYAKDIIKFAILVLLICISFIIYKFMGVNF